MFFIFFKQKTAYEMRISDWSSDVCSSDLAETALLQGPLDAQHAHRADRGGNHKARQGPLDQHQQAVHRPHAPIRVGETPVARGVRQVNRWALTIWLHQFAQFWRLFRDLKSRTEAHTSELQSPMRKCYALFC